MTMILTIQIVKKCPKNQSAHKKVGSKQIFDGLEKNDKRIKGGWTSCTDSALCFS